MRHWRRSVRISRFSFKAHEAFVTSNEDPNIIWVAWLCVCVSVGAGGGGVNSPKAVPLHRFFTEVELVLLDSLTNGDPIYTCY